MEKMTDMPQFDRYSNLFPYSVIKWDMVSILSILSFLGVISKAKQKIGGVSKI